jgi:hypothetical protein
MSIIKNALNKQIQQNNAQQYNDTTATVLEYNHLNGTAKIKFRNPNGEGFLYRDNVRISDMLGGVTGSGIYPGQTCSITFIKNNIYAPVITGLTTNNYANKTCSDQGAYIVDSGIGYIEKPNKIIPMIQNWTEPDNKIKTKYINDLGDYTETDVSKTIHEMLNSLDKYTATEQGITSLTTKATTKFKDNGDIDIFVGNNVGIRISKIDKSISLFGKFKINGQEIDLNKLSNDTLSKE